MDAVSDDSIPTEIIFPSKHYMPKELTQQAAFLEKYPEYDGRGTIIAVIDSGIDPSCPGLQKTNDGKPKIIDCCDLTGAGDVDTSTVKKADENGILIGLTERVLKIPSTWKNPSGEWHLGIKPIFELYSKEIIKRINLTISEEFQKKNKSAIAEVMKELNEHEKEVGSKSKKILDKEDREEINAKMEYLKEAEKLEIESPVADCIVWNDGSQWKACIDLSFTGDLEDAKVMSNFCEKYEYGFISDKCLVSYCLNIHDDGNLLEICVPNGSHGTHVAHIAAGHFPDCPEKDGLAPGAQIVSLCVGDLRRGTTLTSQALIRALNKCIELKVDIINLSYGIPSNCLDSGKSEKFIKDIVEKHGIIFVTAAGNEGPGLSTTSEARTHSSMINVGAYLTAEMKQSMFSHYVADESVVFPFSSRGPCMDGTLGVNISAPGAALTGISKHELMSSNLKNGTSMASPNAAGNIACLLSGMKAESIPISSFRIKLALMNSTKMPEDGSHHPLSLGAGIIQILSAFELIKTTMASIPTNLTDIKIDVNGKRGIYLREPFEITLPKQCHVNVESIFTDSGDHTDRLNFGCPIILKLSPGSDEGFVKFPKYCQLPSQLFHIEIDPTCLEANKVHFAEIIGINPENSSLGPLFRLPITVIIPATVSSESEYRYKKEMILDPAIPQRIFLQSPVGSTYAAVKINSCKNQIEQYITVQRLYLRQKDQCFESSSYIALPPTASEFLHFFCPENQTIEFTFVQQWFKQNPKNVKITIKFFGMSVEPRTLMASNLVNKIWISTYFNEDILIPILKFEHLCQPLTPSDAVIESMKERDIIDGNPSFRLLLTYKFYASKSVLCEFFHEGVRHYIKHMDCYFVQIFTVSKKRILSTCTVGEWVTLEKGDYIIQVQIRHSDPQFLEKLKDSQLTATQTLESEITCDLYSDAESIGKKAEYIILKSGEKDAVYMPAISSDKLPIYYPPGSYLKGKLSLHLKETYKSKCHSSFDIIYLLGPPKSYLNDKKGNLEIEADKENADEKDELKSAIRDIEISYITKESNAEKSLALFEKLSSEFPTHLPIYSAEIERLSKLKDFSGVKKVVGKLLEIADSENVLKYYGAKSEFSEENLRKKEIMEKKKTAIINALFLQANLGLDQFLKLTEKDIPDAFRNGFDPIKINDDDDEIVILYDGPRLSTIERLELVKNATAADGEAVENGIKEAADANDEKESVYDVLSIFGDEKEKSNGEESETDAKERKKVSEIKEEEKEAKNVGSFERLFGKKRNEKNMAEEKQVNGEASDSTWSRPKTNQNNILLLSSNSSSNESMTTEFDPIKSTTMNIKSKKDIIAENDTPTCEDEATANGIVAAEIVENLDADPSTVNLEEVEKVFRDYMLFVDPSSENARIIKAKYAVVHERYGTALSELKQIITDQKTTSDYLSTEKAIIQLLQKLGWNHLAEEAQKAVLIKHQTFYRLF